MKIFQPSGDVWSAFISERDIFGDKELVLDVCQLRLVSQSLEETELGFARVDKSRNPQPIEDLWIMGRDTIRPTEIG